MLSNRLLAGLLPFLATFAEATAQTALTASNVLRIHFQINTPLSRTPDTMTLNFGLTNVAQAYGTRRAVLYDCDGKLGAYGSTLFGNYAGPLNLDPGASWKSPSSLWAFDNAATADFTTIANGTIKGIIDFTIDNGSMSIPLSQVNLGLIAATGSSGGYVVSPKPTVLEAVLVPKMGLPVPGGVNQTNSWSVTGATANSTVYYVIGTLCQPIVLDGHFFDIANPLIIVPIPTDAAGAGSLSVFVPPSAAGGKVLIQGVEILGANLGFTSLSAWTF